MERLWQTLREYPAVAGMGVILLVSLGLVLVFGSLMRQAGVSLKPLVFFSGFLAIIVIPQSVIHLLDALVHRRLSAEQRETASVRRPAPPAITGESESLTPVSWETVFGAEADPALITEATAGLPEVLAAATEARISFSSRGGSALAARFSSPGATREALNRYTAFFRFSGATGSDSAGWTSRRYDGRGEWNHVVRAGNELYAWTGETKESVEAKRVAALGPLPPGPETHSDPAALPKTSVSKRLTRNTPVMIVVLVLNLTLAVGWFFKASAWAAAVPARAGIRPVEAATLRERLLGLNRDDSLITVSQVSGGNALVVEWRYTDLKWVERIRAQKLSLTHKLVLALDEPARKVRVREYWSALDGSTGPDEWRMIWKQATGMQFFQTGRQRVAGARSKAEVNLRDEVNADSLFTLQEMKTPVIEAVTSAGWDWQPVMWNAPAAFRRFTGYHDRQ